MVKILAIFPFLILIFIFGGFNKSLSQEQKVNKTIKPGKPIDPPIKTKIDSTPINNAYDLARFLYQKKNHIKASPDLKRQMLNYLIWYTNVQDEDTSIQVSIMMDSVNKYNSLRNLVNEIYNIDIVSSREIVISNIDDIISNQTIPDKTKKSLKIQVDKIKNVDSLLGDLKVKSSYQRETRITLKSRINSLETKMAEFKAKWISALDTNVIIAVAEKLEYDSTKSQLVQATKDHDSLQKIDIATEFETLMIRSNQLKQELDNYINADSNKLKNIIFAKTYATGGAHNLSMLSPRQDEIELALEEKANINIIMEQQESLSGSLKIPRMPSETEIIDALAIYISKRVKQEAVMFFFETLKADSKRYEMVSTFFPATISLLNSHEVYEIPNLGSTWRYALSRDFIKMPSTLLNSQWLKSKIPLECHRYLPYLTSTVQVADLVMQRYSYRDIVKSMYLKADGESRSAETNPIFSLLYAFNSEFFIKIKDSTYRLLSYEDFRRLNKEEIEIMLSLIDLKYNNCIKRITNNAFIDLKISTNDVEQVRAWLGGIEQGIQQIDKVRKEFIKLQDGMADKENKEPFFNTFNIWDFISELTELAIPRNIKGIDSSYLKKMTKFSSYARMAQEIYSQISVKNFLGAVNSTLLLIENLQYDTENWIYEIQPQGEPVINPMFANIRTTSNKHAFLQSIKSEFKKSGPESLLFQNLGLIVDPCNDSTVRRVRYSKNSAINDILFENDRKAFAVIRKLSGFLNDVIHAKDSKSLSKVVESYAMPPGSYKRKRSSWWSLDLNAFAGVYIGSEWTERVGSDRSWGTVYGLSVPIGITISKTLGRHLKSRKNNNNAYHNSNSLKANRKNINYKTKSTFSITLSIIDIGAVVAYRFSNTEEKSLPQNVKWSQIVSPGIHLSYGINKTPLVIQTGFQFTPQLRKLEDPKFLGKQLDTYRIYLGVFFDLPLFNLWDRKSISYN